MTLQHVAGWIRHAWRDAGRRDLVLALLISVVPMLFGPHGGYFLVTFHEGVDPIFDPDKHYVRVFLEGIALLGLPMVFMVRVADLAIGDGVPRWLAYALALLAVGACAHLYNLVALPWKDTLPPGVVAWQYLNVLFDGGIGLVIYARWRAAQRAARLVQASETERARAAQRVQSARLLALQARVDPQLLFDTLGRVGTLQRHDQASADALLTDLIALLRAMLPSGEATTSNVEREFAVVDAWLRVTRAASAAMPKVQLRVAPGAANGRLAPMLALPLLRAALDVAGAEAIAWRLGAESAAGRLLISLGAQDHMAVSVAAVLANADLAALRERLALLHGDDARLWVSGAPPTLALDLPYVREEDDEADRDY